MKNCACFFKYIFGVQGYTFLRMRTQNPDDGCFWRMRGIAIRKKTKKIYFIYWTFHSTFATSIGAKTSKILATFHFCRLQFLSLYCRNSTFIIAWSSVLSFWVEREEDSFQVGKVRKLLTNLSNSTAISRVKKLKNFHGRPCLVLFISNRRRSFLLCFS